MLICIPTGKLEDIPVLTGTFYVNEDSMILTDEKGDYLKED